MNKDRTMVCGRVLLATFAAIAFLLPLATFGLDPKVGTPPTTTGPISDPQGFINLVAAIVRWVGIIFWIAAVGFVFYAAYIYLTAGGDPERIRKAHKQLLWAIVAIAVALMATGLPLFIRNVLLLR